LESSFCYTKYQVVSIIILFHCRILVVSFFTNWFFSEFCTEFNPSMYAMLRLWSRSIFLFTEKCNTHYSLMLSSICFRKGFSKRLGSRFWVCCLRLLLCDFSSIEFIVKLNELSIFWVSSWVRKLIFSWY